MQFSNTGASMRAVNTYVSRRQHTSAYVRKHEYLRLHARRKRSVHELFEVPLEQLRHHTHTSAYVSIRTAYVRIHQYLRHHTRRQRRTAYASIRQHTSAYVNIRQHTPDSPALLDHI